MRPAAAPRNRACEATARGRRFDLVVFDKDGTLIDFDAMWGGWVLELVAALERRTSRPLAAALGESLGFDPATGGAVAGGPLAVSSMSLLRAQTVGALVSAGIPPAEAAAAALDAWVPPDPALSAVPVTDLPELFRQLIGRGLRIALATSDDREPTRRALDALAVAHAVEGLVAADDDVPAKPAPDPVLRLCRELGVLPARTVVVGDAPADLAMARAAGAGLVVGVLSGVGARGDLEPLADVLLDSVAGLPALLDGVDRGRR